MRMHKLIAYIIVLSFLVLGQWYESTLNVYADTSTPEPLKSIQEHISRQLEKQIAEVMSTSNAYADDTPIEAWMDAILSKDFASRMESVKQEILDQYDTQLTAMIQDVAKDEQEVLQSSDIDILKSLVVEDAIARSVDSLVMRKIKTLNTEEVLEFQADDVQGMPISSDEEVEDNSPNVQWGRRCRLVFPRYIAQPSPDVRGGSGRDVWWHWYSINGRNNLYAYRISCWPGHVARVTLYFRDEDHPWPWIDRVYDAFRRRYYGRTVDIESFYIWRGSWIYYRGIWSSNRPFANWAGVHYSKALRVPDVVHVNVWNHAMGNWSTNWNMWKYYYRIWAP